MRKIYIETDGTISGTRIFDDNHTDISDEFDILGLDVDYDGEFHYMPITFGFEEPRSEPRKPMKTRDSMKFTGYNIPYPQHKRENAA